MLKRGHRIRRGLMMQNLVRRVVLNSEDVHGPCSPTHHYEAGCEVELGRMANVTLANGRKQWTDFRRMRGGLQLEIKLDARPIEDLVSECPAAPFTRSNQLLTLSSKSH